MAQPTQKTTGVLDRAAAAAGGISRRTLAWGGLALGAVILLAVNLIASSALRDARIDLTKERLYTISEGTRKALRAIDEPIDIRVYFSKKLGEAAPSYAKSFERVRTLLEQYRDICARQAAGHLPRSRAVLRRRGSRRRRRPQGHSPQPGRRDGLFRHRRARTPPIPRPTCPSSRPTASGSSNTT